MFQITRNIWQGRFPARERLGELRKAGISHIVNVSESPNQLSETDGPFRRVLWIPVEDLVLIPDSLAIRCLEGLHDCICDQDSNTYIHCVAGWNRSPTILWLYLIACGLDQSSAKTLISSKSFDAVPGHTQLVNDSLVATVIEYGSKRFVPHPRLPALDVIQG